MPLPEPVLAELRRLWKAHGNRRWLCPNAKGDGPITRHALWQTFKKVLAETGIKARVTPHSLRHSYATRLLEAGVSLRIVQILLTKQLERLERGGLARSHGRSTPIADEVGAPVRTSVVPRADVSASIQPDVTCCALHGVAGNYPH